MSRISSVFKPKNRMDIEVFRKNVSCNPLFGDIVMWVGIKGVRGLLENLGSLFHAFRLGRRRRKCLVPLLLLALFSSCTNIKFSDRKPAAEVFLPDQSTLNGAAFTLSRVVIDPNPDFAGSVYNMIGQNGEFDNYCGGSYGTCICVYTYTMGTQVNQISESQVSYQETNMLRCPNGAPSGASSFSVKIRTQAGSGGGPFDSNTLTFTLGAGGAFENSAVYADLADERSYQQIQRYQCRKLEFIPSPFDSAFLDPIQSQDPRIIYPFNFYTGNVGESILALQRNVANAGWECTLTPTFDYELHWWANPIVFSTAPCASGFCMGDGELIYPMNSLESGKVPVTSGSTASGKRRSSFALLPRAYGVFNIPVIAATAPRNYVSAFYSGQAVDDTLRLRPMGFAAQPVVQPGGGSGCPNIPIPAKARWVKLWNFRATDLQPPRRVQSTTATLSSPIACLSSEPNDLFDSCYFYNGSATPTPTPKTLGNSNEATDDTLAYRIGLMPGGGGGGRNASACYKLKNWDTFEASLFAFNYRYSNIEERNLFMTYPWGVYSTLAGTSGFTANLPGGTQSALQQVTGTRPEAIPVDVVDDTVPLSQDLYSDHLFVVTDPSITITDFQDLNSTEAKNYRPVTYRTRGACPGSSRATCSQEQVNWELNTKNINQPLGPEVYPLCVLQFSD